MIKKVICFILCFFLITTTFSIFSVNAVEIDVNHFLLNYGTEQKVFRNFPSQYYNADTDLFYIYKDDDKFTAFTLKNAKTNIIDGGVLFCNWYYSAFQIGYRIDDGSGYKFTLYDDKIITCFSWNSSNDCWDFVRVRNDIRDFYSSSKYIYAPYYIYNKENMASPTIIKCGFIGNPPYIANTDTQLQGLTVGEVSIVPNEAPESSLILLLHNNTTDTLIFTQYLKDIENLSDYISRVDIDDPFSDLAYNLPWHIFPEFEFVEGCEYQLLLKYATNVEPITKTFTVSKTINNTDIPLTNPPSEPTPTSTPDPNQGLIDSNKETQNILNEQTNAIKEQTETNKNIFQKIGDILDLLNPFSENFFGRKLVELIIDGIKSLFIPEDDFFSNYFDEIKSWFSERLGFLWAPFQLLLDILDKILHINFSEPSFSIPDIYEPFTNQMIISSQDFNFNDLLENTSIKTVHDIYLILVDAFIVFNLYKLAQEKLEEVFTK